MGYDECDSSEYCIVEYVDYDGVMQEADCDSFESDFGDDWSDWDDEDTCLENFEGDCSLMLSEEIDNLEYCWLEESWDECLDEYVFCNADLLVDGTWYNTTCDAIEEMFEIEDDSYYSGEEECDLENIEYDCVNNFEDIDNLERCDMLVRYDTCSGEFESCWMDVVVDGEAISYFCDEMVEYLYSSTDCDEMDYVEYADCMFMIPEDMMEVVTSCEFEVEFNGCTGNEYMCWSTAMVYGV